MASRWLLLAAAAALLVLWLRRPTKPPRLIEESPLLPPDPYLDQVWAEWGYDRSKHWSRS